MSLGVQAYFLILLMTSLGTIYNDRRIERQGVRKWHGDGMVGTEKGDGVDDNNRGSLIASRVPGIFFFIFFLLMIFTVD